MNGGETSNTHLYWFESIRLVYKSIDIFLAMSYDEAIKFLFEFR